MHPREAKHRRLMALHNAEMAGREWATSGGTRADNPYRGKKLRGAVIGLFHAWERGFDEQRQTDEPADGRPSARPAIGT